MPDLDYIIVGRGLAGSVLALALMKENKKVRVIDEPSLSSSSKIAAGLFQPMTFKRTVETWKGMESISVCTTFYQWSEQFLETSFFHPLEMYRLFSSFEEQNNWDLKCSDRYFSGLIGEGKNPEVDSCHIPFGYGKVFHAGYLDVLAFLNATERRLHAENAILSEAFQYDDLVISENSVSYRGFSADRIIFCEGWLNKNNPWFGYIPMKPVKGEVLTIEVGDKKFNSVISGGLFCVPRKDGSYKVGSNYDWHTLDEIPTEKIKQDFQNEISTILHSDSVFVKAHKAGVRPASHDRRPIIGLHPQYPQLVIFNGLGARGVALAPFTAAYLIRHLINHEALPDEMNISRFKKYFHSK